MADRSVVIRLRGDISDLQAKMVAAGKSIQHTADKMTGAEKEAVKFRQGLTDLGNGAGKVGLAAAAGIAVAVKAFADFDKAMSGVQAATHATGREMESLRKLALKTGADTAFSAVEAADGIEQLAKAGVSTADIMGGGLQGALDLAAAGTVEVGFAAETAATAMTQFGLSGASVPHIADLLAAAAGKAQGEVADMSMALKQSGLVADQMGLTLEETTGALGAFASAGLLGSDAGTSFKTMLMRLLPQSKEAGDAMEAIGFNAFDAQGDMKSLTEIAGGLQQGLKKMTDEQRQATLASIFGQDAIRAATVLYEQGATGIGEWITKVNDQGYAAETAAIKMDNLSGDLEKLKGALSTLFIEGGETGNDFLRGATQSAEDFVNALSSMPDWASKAAFGLTAITAVVGGGLWFGSKVITGIADTREALAKLNISAQQSAVAMGAAKTAAAGLAAVMAVSLIDSLDDVQLSMRQTLAGFDELALRGVTSAFNDLSWSADTLGEALKQAAYNDLHILDAADEVEALDEALASLAETDLTQARDVFQELIEAGRAEGIELDALIELFPQYAIAADTAAHAGDGQSRAARASARALDETSAASGPATRGLEDVGRAAGDATTQAEMLETALGDLEVVLDERAKKRAYEQSLDDIAERLKERRELIGDIRDAEAEVANAKTDTEREGAQSRLDDLRDQLKGFRLTLNEGAEAGREWNSLLDEVALNALKTAQSLEGMDQVNYLNNARKDFIDLATKITGSRKKARELADELGLLHQKPVKPDIDVPVDKAKNDVLAFRKWIENLPPASLSAQLLLIRNTGLKNDTGEKGDPRFDRGFATGGYTGNYGTSDIAGVVHGREFVFDADLTSRYRSLFESIHRERRVPGYREGGYVAAQTSSTNYYNSGADIDYDRLTSAILRARPMYGDAHFYNQGDVDAERKRARTRAGGGVAF